MHFLLLLFNLVTITHSFPAFRDEIPNGLRSVYSTDPKHGLTRGRAYRALGHLHPNGGGKLNIFGKAFKAANYEWTVELCRADSDNDGESNGLELGDPCCLWKVGETPMRQYRMSHPGIATSKSNITFNYETTCLLKQGNNKFWDFYYQPQDDKRDIKPFKTVDVDVKEWWSKKMKFIHHNGGWTKSIWKTIQLNGKRKSLMVSSKNIFSLLVVGMATITTLLLLLKHDQCCCSKSTISHPNSNSSNSYSNNLQLFVAAALYTDIMSGLLHLVLDNPIMNTWPIIGKEALAFQGHHFDPSGIARGPILDMVREDHSLVFIGMLVFFLFRPTSANLLKFSLWFCFFSHFMMASHRWSHTHPKYLHWSIKAAQKYGLIMTTEHHSKHHASYDCNFSIFNGLSNPLLNKLIYIIHWKSPIWFVLLCLGFAVPIVLTNESVKEWCVNVPFRLFHGCKQCVLRGDAKIANIDTNRNESNTTSNTSKSDNDSQRNRETEYDNKTTSSTTTTSPPTHFTVIFNGYNYTKNQKSKTAAAYCTQFIGILLVLLMLGSLLLRKTRTHNTTIKNMAQLNQPIVQALNVNKKIRAHSHHDINRNIASVPDTLVILHTACMSIAVLICTTYAVTSYAFVDRDRNSNNNNKPKIRSRHRTCNMFSAFLMLFGIVLILIHVTIQHERVVRPRSSHMWLAIFVIVGVGLQIWGGVIKYAAIKAGKTLQGFKWHGKVGWIVFVAMLFTINSGIVESDMYSSETFLQMAIQILLLLMGLGAAHALGKLPAFQLVLEDPFSHVFREHLNATVPDVIVVYLTSNPKSCMRQFRPHRLAGTSHQKKQKENARSRIVRQIGIIVAIGMVVLVLLDVWYGVDDSSSIVCSASAKEVKWRMYGKTCHGMEKKWKVCTNAKDRNHAVVMKNCPVTCAKYRKEPCPMIDPMDLMKVQMNQLTALLMKNMTDKVKVATMYKKLVMEE